MDAKDITNFFITFETPKLKEDLRFVAGTFKGETPTVFKDRLVAWANRPKNGFATGWEYLKDYWESLRPSGVSPVPYPKISGLFLA
jgi:hypothetical protein